MVGSCYCQPKDSRQWDALLAAIRIALFAARSTHTPVLLLGDFNARHTITGERCKDSHRGKSLAAFLEEQDLHLLNSSLCHGQATFPVSSSILDLALATDPSLVSLLRPQPALLLHSDHYPMLGRFASQQQIQSVPPLLLPSNQRQGKASSLSSPKLAFDRMDIKTFQSLLEPLCTSWLADRNNRRQLDSAHTHTHRGDPAAAQSAIGSLTQSLSTCFHDAAAACAPRLPPERRVINHWWTATPGVRAALANYHRCYRRYRKDKSDQVRRDEYHESRRAWRAIRSQAKQKAWADLCSKISDPEHRKLAWSAWHRTLPSAFAPLNSIRLTADQPLPSSHRESLDRMTMHFADTCSSTLNGSPHERKVLEAVERMSNESIGQRDRAATISRSHGQLNRPFTVDEVQRAASNQRLRTALGPDGFSPYFIKHATPAALTALTALLNFSWRYGVMPASWRSANIMPLLKDPAADRSSPTNFRPISLTSVLIRFFERVVLYRLRPLITKHLVKQQAGFRAQHSTYTHLHRLQHVITSAFEKHRYQSVAFLDISKAFDSTWHAGILYKLANTPFMITGRAWHWVEALLTDRSIRVVDQGLEAGWQSITAGVPQGSVLAPFLFVLYINDIVHERGQCEMALYADDIALWGRDCDTKGDEQLRECMPHLLRWSERWKLAFNMKKSASVCFRRKRKPRKKFKPTSISHFPFPTSTSDFQLPPPFLFSASLILPQTDSYKYLGLIFDYKLGWHEQTAAVQKKLQQWVTRISRIIPAVADGPGPSLLVIRQLTHSILRSQLCYGLPIWSPPTQPMKQQLQSLLARPLLRSLALPQSTHQLSLLVECASTSFSALYQSSLVNFYQRMQRTPTQQATHQLFQQQRARFVSREPADWKTVKGSFLHALKQLPPARRNLLAAFDCDSLPCSAMHLAREITFGEWNNPSPAAKKASRSNSAKQQPLSSSSSSSSSSSPSDSPSAVASHLPVETLAGSRLLLVRSADQVQPSYYLSVDSTRVAQLRARLRLGRARLADSCYKRGMANTDSSSPSAPVSPLCPHPPCHRAGLKETTEHALLECPLYEGVRGSINSRLLQHPSFCRTMTLADALGAVEGISSKADRRLILEQTSRLLLDLDRHRHL